MMYYLIIGAVFVSIVLLIIAFSSPVVFKRRSKSSISQLSYYSTDIAEKKKTIPSFTDRMVLPVFTRIAQFIKRISPKGIVKSNRQKLMVAGISGTYGVDIYLAIKFLFPIGFLFLFIILAIFTDISLVLRLLLLIFIPISYFFPDLYIRSRIKSRQLLIRKALPNALDLLSISVEAGMGFDIALSRVADNVRGPLGEEFKKMLQDLQLGLSRKEAFQNLNKRTDVSELNSFIVAMTQAEIFGISIGKVLKVQASEIRTKRRQRAEEEGVKAPVKLVFPLILCLFPALMTVILGPAVIRVMDALVGVIGGN
ncbi:type II secretion system F family protein [Actinomycetota bacterium]